MSRTVGHQRRVLLVEDDAWIRTFLRDVLSDEGYDVLEAADGRTGLRLAGHEHPDVVLLDLAMPEFTGVEVLRDLRQLPRTQKIPVLILSAYPNVLPTHDAERVAGVLTKPLNVPELLSAVQHALETRPTRARTSRRRAPYLDQDGLDPS
jgi:CheY-like chemotaxis protein